MADIFEMGKFLIGNTSRGKGMLTIGKNISLMPEVKIIFDGYGDEGANKNLEHYSMYIHKDSLLKDFKFPDHQAINKILVARPETEVSLSGMYEVSENIWHLNFWDEVPENAQFSDDDMEAIIEKLYQKYSEPLKVTDNASKKWPFNN
jgi:hypothetical protein